MSINGGMQAFAFLFLISSDRAMACVLALAALPEEGMCKSVWLPARPVLPDYADIYSKEEMERLLARYRPW